MPKQPGPLDQYVAEVEAQFGDFKSNRTLVAELVDKERASERELYKAVARVVARLYEQWDREKHAALGEKERKRVSFEPRLIIYPDGSKKFSCPVSIIHYDLNLLDAENDGIFQQEQHSFSASSLEEFTHVIASAYDLSLSYVQDGFKPNMYSVRTITPEIHFAGYCPSPIPEYVTSLRKRYTDPRFLVIEPDLVEKWSVAVRPWCPIPDEPEYLLLTYLEEDGSRMYNLLSVLEGFHPILNLKQAKELKGGQAVDKRGLYALAWLGITPFARELTRLHTQQTYYAE